MAYKSTPLERKNLHIGISLGVMIGIALTVLIVFGVAKWVGLKTTVSCTEFDFHMNYSVEGEGIIFYDADGKTRIGAVDYKDAGKIDSLLKMHVFGINRMPPPKELK